MKKKMIFALLLAGMSFVAPNVADAQEKVVAPATTDLAAPAKACFITTPDADTMLIQCKGKGGACGSAAGCI